MEGPSIHTTMVKRIGSEFPATLDIPGRPVGTPDNGESVEVQHGLAERNNGNRASRDGFVCGLEL